jgi:hypothetical protein
MAQKNLTAREARKRKQKLNTIWGIVGGVITASALVLVFVFTQGDSLQDPADYEPDYASNSDDKVTYVDTDGSDPDQERSELKAEAPLDYNIPKLIQSPRFAWDSMYYRATNKDGGGESPSQGMNNLWELDDSTFTSATYAKDGTGSQCEITYENNELDGKFTSDLEATESLIKNAEYVDTLPVFLWTSYNLRDYYNVSFAQVENSPTETTLVRASADNNLALVAHVSCEDETPAEDMTEAVNDTLSLMIIIVPIEVQ